MSYVVNTFGEELDLRVLAPTLNDTDPVLADNILSWDAGNGEQRLVIVAKKPIDFILLDTVTYPVNRGIPGIGYVAQRSIDLEFNMSGFTSGKYHIYIVPFNGQSSNEVYYKGTYLYVEVILSSFDDTFDETFE